MNLVWAIQQLTDHGANIAQLCTSASEAQARIKPDPQSWSMREVVDHLYDEECNDFRQLLVEGLHLPVMERSHHDLSRLDQRNFHQSVAMFAAERQRSIVWLRALPDTDWNQPCSHPRGFVLRAGDVLSAWVAHDVLHLRQLVELHFHLVNLGAAPYSVEYAGEW